jgi:hypothetical protein
LANPIANSRRSASVTASSRPDDSAVSPSTGRPASSICSACFAPMIRGRRCVPPAPGTIPRLISGKPNLVSRAATR